jgi:hypothetical protein
MKHHMSVSKGQQVRLLFYIYHLPLLPLLLRVLVHALVSGAVYY